MSLSLEFIRDEHRNIARVLKALENLARDDSALKKAVGSDLLASILYYLRVYPYAVHHPKEERYLFPAAAARNAAAAAAVEALRQEHTEGYAELRKLDLAASACADAAGLARLKEAILAFVAHEYGHMKREETEIIPVAERALTPEETVAMRRHFAAGNDPVFGENIQTGFEALFRHITDRA